MVKRKKIKFFEKTKIKIKRKKSNVKIIQKKVTKRKCYKVRRKEKRQYPKTK